MKNKTERFWRDPGFYFDDTHVQRCTEAAWRDALLHNQDKFVQKGITRQLIGTPIGFGVVEVRIKK